MSQRRTTGTDSPRREYRWRAVELALASARASGRLRGRVLRGWVATAVGLVLACAPRVAVHAGADTDAGVTLELGGEYDSNVHRIESLDGAPVQEVASPLMRMAARARGSLRWDGGHSLSARALAAAKWFATDEASAENVGALAVRGRYDRAVKSRELLASLSASYYDAFGIRGGDSARTFSSGRVTAGLNLMGPTGHRGAAEIGLRTFAYDPNPRFDWRGERLAARYVAVLWREDAEDVPSALELSAGYAGERRDYDSAAQANACPIEENLAPECRMDTGFDRVDMVHHATLSLSFSGDWIYGVSYELQINDSNSFGHSLVRHRAAVSVTAEMPGEVVVTGRATLQYNVFLDPLLVARDVSSQTFVTIDDENRNSFVVHASREIAAGIAAELRYGFHTNEFATQETRFRRHVGYMGLVYSQ